MSTTCSPKGVLSPKSALNLYGLRLGVVWSFVLALNRVIGCPTLGSTFVWSSRSCFLNGLWFWARLLLSVTVGYISVLSTASTCHACYLKLGNKGDHREIEKTVEDVCCHVLLLSTSILESRDEIPVRGVELWQPQISTLKIWAKFSLFDWHCIMASI